MGGSDNDPLAAINAKLDLVIAGLVANQQNQEQIMLDLSGLQEAVEYDTAVDTSARALIEWMADQIENAPDQEAVDQIVATLRERADEMAQFVAANTPAETEPSEGGETGGDEPTVDDGTGAPGGGTVTDTPTGVDPVTGERIDDEGPTPA